VFGFFYSMHQIGKVEKLAGIHVSDSVIQEYFKLFPKIPARDLVPNYSYICDDRSPFGTFDLKAGYSLIVCKIDSLEDVPLPLGISIQNNKAEKSMDNVYNVINENYFKMYNLHFSPRYSKKMFITFDGDSLKNIVRNDSVVQYYLRFNSFSLRYSLNGPIDILCSVKGESIPANFLFFKKDKQMYFAILSIDSINAVLPYNYLSELVK